MSGRRPAPSSQPLIRACGKKAGCRTVLDATAGLLGDAILLVRAGFEVIAVERSAQVRAMHEEILARAREEDDELGPLLDARLTIIAGDARDVLRRIAADDRRPDVVYIDPMHPPTGKSRAVKKEMVLLREIVGSDEDAPEVVRLALGAAGRRVVVKLPRIAGEILPGVKPTASIVGRAVRYDIFTPARGA